MPTKQLLKDMKQNSLDYLYAILCLVITHTEKELTLWSWVSLEMPQVVQPLGSFPAFYGTRRFITAFTRALPQDLSWGRQIQSTPPNPISKRFIIMLPIHLHVVLPSGLFPSKLAKRSFLCIQIYWALRVSESNDNSLLCLLSFHYVIHEKLYW
jgi:hypothetical protein